MGRQPLLFIQGAGDMREPEGSGQLADYLDRELGSQFRVIAPEMPDPENPRYRPWRDRIEQELTAIEGAILLVGHSFGASVLLKYLAEGSVKHPITGLFLVSVPDWGPQGWAVEEYALPSDFGASTVPATKIFLYHSLHDPEVPFEHLRHYERMLPNAVSRPIRGSQHSFVDGLPELVEDIRGLES